MSIQYSYLPDSGQEIFSDDSALLSKADLQAVLRFLPDFRLYNWNSLIPRQSMIVGPSDESLDLHQPTYKMRRWERKWYQIEAKNICPGHVLRVFLAAVSNDGLEILGPQVNPEDRKTVIGLPPPVQVRVAAVNPGEEV